MPKKLAVPRAKPKLPPLHVQALRNIGKMRNRSSLTALKNRTTIKRLCKLIHKLYGLQNLRKLNEKHIRGAFKVMQECGYAKSTLAGYATAARYIANAIGKPHIVPPNKELGADRSPQDRYKPTYPDPEQIKIVRERLYGIATWLGLAHDMREAFGLRAKESLLSVETRTDQNGQQYLIVKGAKGGRPREIPIITPKQKDTIRRVQKFISQNGWKSLIPPWMLLKDAVEYQRDILHAVGATKKNHANAHSLRHQFARDLLLMGKFTPREIAEILGHGRTEVLKFYLDGDLLQKALEKDKQDQDHTAEVA